MPGDSAAFDQLSTPIALAGADGAIVTSNAACAHWLGVGTRRLSGLPLAALEFDGAPLDAVALRLEIVGDGRGVPEALAGGRRLGRPHQPSALGSVSATMPGSEAETRVKQKTGQSEPPLIFRTPQSEDNPGAMQ